MSVLQCSLVVSGRCWQCSVVVHMATNGSLTMMFSAGAQECDEVRCACWQGQCVEHLVGYDWWTEAKQFRGHNANSLGWLAYSSLGGWTYCGAWWRGLQRHACHTMGRDDEKDQRQQHRSVMDDRVSSSLWRGDTWRELKMQVWIGVSVLPNKQGWCGSIQIACLGSEVWIKWWEGLNWK